MNSEIINSVRNLLPIGRANYSTFMKDRIISQKVSWGAKIPQTKLPLMGYSSKPTKQKSETATFKQERSQYIQMLLSAKQDEKLMKMC